MFLISADLIKHHQRERKAMLERLNARRTCQTQCYNADKDQAKRTQSYAKSFREKVQYLAKYYPELLG